MPPARQRRHFQIDVHAGPRMVVFDDPSAPRVLSIGPDTARYGTTVGAWSSDGWAFAYALSSHDPAPVRYLLMLARAGEDFVPRQVEHDRAQQPAFGLQWVGSRAFVVQVAQQVDVTTPAYDGRYLWVDADTLAVHDLGGLPADYTPYASVMWASPHGVLFSSDACELTYVEDPELGVQPLLDECSPSVYWSNDGNYAAVLGSNEARLFRREERQLHAIAVSLPGAPDSPSTRRWEWAPSTARFVTFLTDGEDEPGHDLVLGDASTGAVETLELADLWLASFLADDLLLARSLDGAAHLAVPSDTAPSLSALDIGQPSNERMVASSDARRLYLIADPLLEIELDQGTATNVAPIVSSPGAPDAIDFELFESDDAALLTFFEPERFVGPAENVGLRAYHQYLVSLPERSAVTLAQGNFVTSSQVLGEGWGDKWHVPAPQFAGVFYSGEDADGLYVDWLSFDDPSRRSRLIQYFRPLVACCQFKVPSHVAEAP